MGERIRHLPHALLRVPPCSQLLKSAPLVAPLLPRGGVDGRYTEHSMVGEKLTVGKACREAIILPEFAPETHRRRARVRSVAPAPPPPVSYSMVARPEALGTLLQPRCCQSRASERCVRSVRFSSHPMPTVATDRRRLSCSASRAHASSTATGAAAGISCNTGSGTQRSKYNADRGNKRGGNRQIRLRAFLGVGESDFDRIPLEARDGGAGIQPFASE